MNKYLEKAAKLQEQVDETLDHHYGNIDDIEAPINEFEESLDEMRQHYSHGRERHSDWLADNIIASRVDSMRDRLKIDDQLEENDMGTGKSLLTIGDIQHDLAGPRQASRIIKHIEGVQRPMNGWRGLANGAGVLGSIAGGVGGFAYGVKKNNPLIAGVAGIGGVIALGLLAGKGTHALIDDKIDARDKQIYDQHERNLQHAYEVLKERLQKGSM